MKTYYKRVNKSDNEGIERAMQGYEAMKAKKGVIVGNDEQGEFILYPTEMDGEFVITCLSREDFKTQGFNPAELTDSQMEEIADEMAESYVGYGDYWDSIDDYAKNNNLPRCTFSEDDDDDE